MEGTFQPASTAIRGRWQNLACNKEEKYGRRRVYTKREYSKRMHSPSENVY